MNSLHLSGWKTTINKKIIYLLAYIILIPFYLFGDAGVLIPSSVKDYPDPSLLSCYRTEVNITIRDRIAETKVLQVYQNHTKKLLEGSYIFTIPEEAMIKDFAIWENGIRIPGIIMERKRAKDLYKKLVRQRLDPGLVERAEMKHKVNYFNVRVAPIPPYGTKRIELFYTQLLSINQGSIFYNFPFKPSIFAEEATDSLSISIQIEDSLPIEDFLILSKNYPFKVTKTGKNKITAVLNARDVNFTEDLLFSFKEHFENVSLKMLTYRNPEKRGEYFYLDGIPSPTTGFFALEAGFNIQNINNEKQQKNYLFLFDNSLSMMWDKLEVAYTALSNMLSFINKNDNINIGCFSSNLSTKWNTPLKNNEKNRNDALNFIRSKYISGGTNIEDVLKTVKEKENIVPIIITDGYPTVGEIDYEQILKNLNGLPPLFIIGIGDNANKTLLKELSTRTGGNYLWLKNMNSEKLKLFLRTTSGEKITNVTLQFSPSSAFTDIYPGNVGFIFNGNGITFSGKYLTPKKKANVTLSFIYNGKRMNIQKSFTLPKHSEEYKEVRRLWAKRRVDFLLDKIRIEGEKDKWIKEIVALSKEFKFVTPYTSFLAAPRALLRPRIIRPGDPMLIVKADTGIVDIVAIFPFGLTKRMVFHKEEGVFRTRFLVPANTPDGKYRAVLIMKDKNGNIIRESKIYIIDRKPPTLRIELPKTVFSAGEEVLIKTFASKDTRKIEASIGKSPPFKLVYNPAYLASIGIFKIPDYIPTGRYTLRVVAEDFAYNTTYRKMDIDIVNN